MRAVDAGLQFKLIVECEILNRHGIAQTIIRRLVKQGASRVRVSPEVFRAMSTAHAASGVGAILKQPWMSPQLADPDTGLCWIAAESIRSDGNLGTMLRTAEAVGAAGLWAIGDVKNPHSPDPFAPACVRATMGGLFNLKLIRASRSEFARWKRKHQVHVIGLDANARCGWNETIYPDRTVLIAGDERDGISPRLRRLCDDFTRLPMVGSADSLNVGVAMSVVMYEMVRQR